MKLRKPPVVVISLFVSSVLAGYATVALAARGEDDLVPAAPGEPSYSLSVDGITYPFVETLPDGRRKVDPARAGVVLGIRWTSEAFPGEAECEITFTDGEGRVTDTVRFNLGSLTPDAVHDSSFTVSRAPAAATAICAAASRPAASADPWSISNVTIERDEQGPPLLVGEIRWNGGAYPGWAACSAQLVMGDGTTRAFEFNMDMPEGKRVLAILPPDLLDARSADEVTCLPFTGE